MGDPNNQKQGPVTTGPFTPSIPRRKRGKMKNESRPIESLDSKHMMSLILYIHESGPCRRTEIYQYISRNGNMPQKIDAMIERNILTEKPNYNGSILELTESGHMIAEHLRGIEDLMS